jgi:hypothetical protein
MSKLIILWGVILCGCVCVPQSLMAASLDWEAGRESIEMEMTARQISSFPGKPVPDNVLIAQSSPETAFVMTSLLHTDTVKITATPFPIFALPESGTLILLGLGLAGLASLIRKKKPPS